MANESEKLGTGCYVSLPPAGLPSAEVRALMAARAGGYSNRAMAQGLQEVADEWAAEHGGSAPAVSVGGVFGQPLDFIAPGGPLPVDCGNPDGSINGAKLLRALVPTLTEARAVEIAGYFLPGDRPKADDLRALIARYAPGRV